MQTKTRKSEEQIVADLEAKLLAKKNKIAKRSLLKANSYVKTMERARKALQALRACPEWPSAIEPHTSDVLNLIELEVDRLVLEGRAAPQ